MADAPDLGSGVHDVQVQVLLSAVNKGFQDIVSVLEPYFFAFDINGDINAGDKGWNVCCNTG